MKDRKGREVENYSNEEEKVRVDKKIFRLERNQWNPTIHEVDDTEAPHREV